MNRKQESFGCGEIWRDYEKGVSFNTRIGLYDTVAANENFFIGRQWEGVRSNGLPTPVFNFLKRVVLFRVSSIVSDNLKMQASPMEPAGLRGVRRAARAVTGEFDRLFERNKMGSLLREYVRNASVDGDGCLYTYYDPDAPGPFSGGEIITELVENTRVLFGNPNDRRVERQPWIIVARREPLEEVRRLAEEAGEDPDAVRPDTDDAGNYHDSLTDDKCTVLLKFWKERDRENGERRLMAAECTRDRMLRQPWDTGLTLYPVTWLSMDYVQDCYHGQADVTGLIPNQIFVNKLFAMTMLSLMSSAYPRILYDRTRIARWDNRVGAAIPMNGGDVAGAAKIIDPAQVSPQISQFISLAISYTKEFMGANDAALGDVQPNNTSAIIALQRASAVPMELVRRNLHQSIEDLGRIYMDQMAAFYGRRPARAGEDAKAAEDRAELFDFAALRNMPLSLKLDVGASAYWSEITSVQTLDNLLAGGKISVLQYLERLPSGYVTGKEELMEELKNASKTPKQSSAGNGLTGASLPPRLLAGRLSVPAG
ncbi:hypothetical protein [Papillibacter cinnamivorans]|uniref:Phage portal protein, SPP1 Gp6-like n=1 Tax=Papillibacter cinnamivorans DSM 12816 TaxID=1122930 RepID=A0A1W2C667_9FIRM|nr:hypothetical protein [Papillibacter cinnamivorans]SMC80514.1 hypothetical protein SAMN02745168_2579 [Papillibacter cinnamivorans DSM 12816]